jgi:hypothetical protein
MSKRRCREAWVTGTGGAERFFSSSAGCRRTNGDMATSGPHRRVASPFRAAEDCVQKAGLMTRPCTTKMLGEKPACTGAGTSVE